MMMMLRALYAEGSLAEGTIVRFSPCSFLQYLVEVGRITSIGVRSRFLS